MYGPRRRAVYSPFARFEFLVFLIPLFFFIMAFVVISMTIMPDPHANKRPQGLPSPPALQPRTALKAVSSPSSQLLCGHSMAGVAASDWADYCGGAGGFVCRSSRELIDSVQVNDDFCDCADGSDEVGTSACSLLSSARFTCKTQQQMRLPTSMVNDGLCDCCDGYEQHVAAASVPATHGPLSAALTCRVPPPRVPCVACRSDEWASNACIPRCTSSTATLAVPPTPLPRAPPLRSQRQKKGQG